MFEFCKANERSPTESNGPEMANTQGITGFTRILLSETNTCLRQLRKTEVSMQQNYTVNIL